MISLPGWHNRIQQNGVTTFRAPGSSLLMSEGNQPKAQNFTKIHFAKPEVKYLGHMVSKEGINPDPDKIQAIK